MSHSNSGCHVGLIVALLLAIPLPASSAAVAAWRGTAADALSDAGRWSAGIAPGPEDVVNFDASSGDCRLDGRIRVAGFRIEAGYTGTITQPDGGVLEIGLEGFRQEGGIFRGGDQPIRCQGPVSITGGTFVAPTGRFEIDGDLHIGPSGFDPNDGIIFLSGAGDRVVEVDPSVQLCHLTIELATPETLVRFPQQAAVRQSGEFLLLQGSVEWHFTER